jgi:hypothetical protein
MLFLADQEKADLVNFLMALTDPRVRNETAPFDHPSLSIPVGGTPGISQTVNPDGTPCAPGGSVVCVLDDRITLHEVGAAGNPAPLGTINTTSANFPDPLQ